MAQPTIGNTEVFDISGLLPAKPQRSVRTNYHADGQEQDATEVIGAPFALVVKILDTLATADAKYEELAGYAGNDTVDITIGDGTIFPDCSLGGDRPGVGVAEIPGTRQTVDHEGTTKVVLTLSVVGHQIVTSE
jgi:hypothetical protein